MVRNLVLSDLRPYIQRYTSPNENLEYGYPHSNGLLQSHFKLKCCKRHKATHHPTKCDVINDLKLSQDILSQSFDVIQSDVMLQKQVH